MLAFFSIKLFDYGSKIHRDYFVAVMNVSYERHVDESAAPAIKEKWNIAIHADKVILTAHGLSSRVCLAVTPKNFGNFRVHHVLPCGLRLPNCSACDRLWREYAAATVEHIKLENHLKLAALRYEISAIQA